LVIKESSAGTPLIGMGENLANFLIASYGGHFLRMEQAVSALRRKKEEHSADMTLNPIMQKITEALKANPERCLTLLGQMAEYGFAPVKDLGDSVVETIVRTIIGGIVVKQYSTVAGLSTDIWTGNGSLIPMPVLIPTSESACNLISLFVVEEKEKRRRKEEKKGLV